MRDPGEQTPIPAERPAPPGQEVQAPELAVEPADDRELPDGQGLSDEAGMPEPPD